MIKKIRKMGIMIFVAVMLFTNCCFASSVGESQLAKGTENLIKKLGNDTKLVTIFLKVDKEELKNRLINRGDNLSEADMQLRLGRLEYEESKIGLYDYVIKNDNLEKTVQIIMTIIENEKKLEETKIKN